jgi:hypothetical protein
MTKSTLPGLAPLAPDLGEFQKIAGPTDAPVINPGAIDPNTGKADTPLQDAVAAAPVLTPQEQYVDEWAKDPTGNPPVRTWVDPTARDASDGTYEAAFNDTPVEEIGDPAPPVTTAPAALTPTPKPVDNTQYQVYTGGMTDANDNPGGTIRNLTTGEVFNLDATQAGALRQASIGQMGTAYGAEQLAAAGWSAPVKPAPAV